MGDHTDYVEPSPFARGCVIGFAFLALVAVIVGFILLIWGAF